MTDLAKRIQQSVRPARLAEGLIIEWECPRRQRWIECSYASTAERDDMLAYCERKGYATRTVNK